MKKMFSVFFTTYTHEHTIHTQNQKTDADLLRWENHLIDNSDKRPRNRNSS